tara:strand:- start:70 stop:1221 length:1152 start_codon:yes stop_codon:yes gene_type:complete
MNRSYSKIRHIQESNERLENRLISEVNKVNDFDEYYPEYNYTSLGVLPKKGNPNNIGVVFFNGTDFGKSEYRHPEDGERSIIFIGKDGKFEFDSSDIRYDGKTPYVFGNKLSNIHYDKLLPLIKTSDGSPSLSSVGNDLSVNLLKTKKSGIPQHILDTLKDVYPNNWGRISEPGCETLDGVIDVFPAIEGERWSILNFFDTNPGVIKILVDKYKDENETNTLDGFKQWLTDNKYELFGKDSELLASLVKRNRRSFESGWETESKVINRIKELSPSLKDEDIIQYCLGSIRDRIDSIDVSIKGKGYQIKPLSKIEPLDDGSFSVTTYGMKDWYKNKVSSGLNYILYSNGKDIVVFHNKNYKVDYSSGGKKVIHYDKPIRDTRKG